MKIFKAIKLSAICLLLSIANANESKKTVVFDGKPSVALELSSSQYHTEYTYERIWTTCSRQVFDGYDQVCSIFSALAGIEKRRICERDNGRVVCHDDGSYDGGYGNDGGDNGGSSGSYTPTCHSVSRYRTEYYSCEEVVRHPYSVFDFSTAAKAILNFPDMKGAERKIAIDVDLSDSGYLQASAKNLGQEKFLVYGNWGGEKRGGTSTARTLSSELSLAFADGTSVWNLFKNEINKVDFENGELVFLIASIKNPELFNIQLKVKQVRWFLLKDKVVLDDVLSAQKFHLVDTAQGTQVKVPLSDRGVFQPGKKYKVEITLFPSNALLKSLLNGSELPKFKKFTSEKIKFE